MKKDDWEINPDEVEFGTILGIGGCVRPHPSDLVEGAHRVVNAGQPPPQQSCLTEAGNDVCSFGEVHKAKWRGTDVAVKVMHSKDITKDMERNFKEEVRSVAPDGGQGHRAQASGLGHADSRDDGAETS